MAPSIGSGRKRHTRQVFFRHGEQRLIPERRIDAGMSDARGAQQSFQFGLVEEMKHAFPLARLDLTRIVEESRPSST